MMEDFCEAKVPESRFTRVLVGLVSSQSERPAVTPKVCAAKANVVAG